MCNDYHLFIYGVFYYFELWIYTYKLSYILRGVFDKDSLLKTRHKKIVTYSNWDICNNLILKLIFEF